MTSERPVRYATVRPKISVQLGEYSLEIYPSASRAVGKLTIIIPQNVSQELLIGNSATMV